MAILSFTTDVAGQIAVYPRRVKLVTTDDLDTITTAGYLSSATTSANPLYANDFVDVCYEAQSVRGPGTMATFTVTFSGSIPTLVPFP